MKIPVHIAEKLSLLSEGKVLPAGSARHVVVEELVAEGIIFRTGRIQKKLSLNTPEALHTFLFNRYGINDLTLYIEMNKKDGVKRSELVTASGNSKLKRVRTFKGFLVNSYQPIHGTLNDQPIVIFPPAGTFSFIYEVEHFIPDPDVTIVGIENSENFSLIERQRYLFEKINPLFVSRYPQSQSRDLIKWLQRIPNTYLHFGDFDLAGIGIYLNEFKKYLGKKSTFFTPGNIEELFKNFGNAQRYDQQPARFNREAIRETGILDLLKLIHHYKKGVDQEVLIHTGQAL